MRQYLRKAEAMRHSEMASNQDVSPDPSDRADSGIDGINRRLQQLEIKMTRLETKFECLPVKEDLDGIKILIAEIDAKNTKWMITIVSGAWAVPAIAFIRMFFVAQ